MRLALPVCPLPQASPARSLINRLTLPFTLVEVLGVKMVPACSLIAFTLIGIEYIAQELEMPFGIDPNDLPLDLLCASLRNEVEHMIGRLVLSGGEEWM